MCGLKAKISGGVQPEQGREMSDGGFADIEEPCKVSGAAYLSLEFERCIRRRKIT
jgi:hypothetical protein